MFAKHSASKKGSTNIRITSDKSDQELIISVKVVDDTNYNDKDKLTAKQIYAQCKSATVEIRTNVSLGSGFYIAKGKVITNYHVIKESTSISVVNTDGNTYLVTKILGYDEALDIAILSV
ncbi:MAG: trypsin-like peptidase domain-containing protein, partial [Clostridiales bacterium]|nr:trypsin-like peptidase domain-containing protein [Clostridiales bacterium]